MEIVALRSLRPRALNSLFDEQAEFWREQFLWDYRPAIDMIRRFVDARSLDGFAVLMEGEAVAYCFYVLEDSKGQIGDCFISPRVANSGVARELLVPVLNSLGAIPGLRRIETHILPSDEHIHDFFAERHFMLRERQFMHLPLVPDSVAPTPASPSPAFLLEKFSQRCLDGGARLIQLAYASHVDGEINDQYRSEAGATRFIRNLMQTPASGEFIRDASFVLRPRAEFQPVGIVLSSRVAASVAHITQICVLPGYQHNGLGRALMHAAMNVLRNSGYSELTLTVTSANESAVRLYDQLGFRTLRTFSAGVWRA